MGVEKKTGGLVEEALKRGPENNLEPPYKIPLRGPECSQHILSHTHLF
jgi:hypothetical protein